MTMQFDLSAETRKLTEAWAIEHNLPCKRQYTHEELEGAFRAVRAAARDVEILRFEQLFAKQPTYWDEKAKDRREEFLEEDDINRQRAYPERQP